MITGLDVDVLSGEKGGIEASSVSESNDNCIGVPEVGHLPVRGHYDIVDISPVVDMGLRLAEYG